MLSIPCPWCGERDVSEFHCGGEAEWGDYLFMRKNPKGLCNERWFHAHGCRRWFHVVRSTVSHEILKVYGITEPPPPVDGDGR
jgi:heterotetrameric sarcosine oxidase delta subunit